MNTPVSSTASGYWKSRKTIVGAFWDSDFRLFDTLLCAQDALDVTGDLLEIGALYGKSAILLGVLAGQDDTVHVCDVFEQDTGDEANRAENDSSYPGLARDKFEANYRTFVDRDPHIIAELSTSIAKHVDARSLRFAHVDGGHLFETVVEDLRNVRPLLGPRGIIVLDDIRALHTPGVAAAAWGEVVGGGLVPFAMSEQKLYATWGPVEDYALHLETWLDRNSDVTNYGYQDIAGHCVLIIGNPRQEMTARDRIWSWLPILPPAVQAYMMRDQVGPHLGTRRRS